MSKIPEPLQLFLNEANKIPVEYTVDAVRKNAALVVQTLALPKCEIPLIENLHFTEKKHSVPVRLYHPAPRKTLPLLLYFHGGGHLCGTLDIYDALCRRLAHSSHCAVLSVGYRLAPEYPYPAGLQDCMFAFEKSLHLSDHYAVDTEKLFIGGDSAGGNLAVSVAYNMKIKRDTRMRGLILLYPSLDFTMQQPSITRKGEGYLLTKEKIAWYFDQYFLNGGDRRKASPLYFDHLQLLPPMYIALAEWDPLHDEGQVFAQKAKALQVSVNVEEFKGMTHAFAQLEKLVPDQINQLLHSITHFIRYNSGK